MTLLKSGTDLVYTLFAREGGDNALCMKSSIQPPTIKGTEEVIETL